MRSSVYLLAIIFFIPCTVSGATIHSLCVTPANSGEVYTSSYCDGLWIGNAALTTWAQGNTGLTTPFALGYFTVTGIAVAPSNTSSLYCATSRGNIYQSANQGSTWSVMNIKLRRAVRALVVDPADSTHLFAGNTEGLFEHTTVLGWVEILPGTGTVFEEIAFDPFDSHILYATTHNKRGGGSLFCSTDSGANWSAALFAKGLHDIGLDPGNVGTIYLTTYSGIYKTANGGASWDLLTTGLPGTLITDIVVDPVDTDVVYAGSMTGLYYTDDGGTNWYNTNWIANIITCLAYSQDGNSLYIGTGENGLLTQVLTE